jgi:hypothetical protein
MDLKELGSSSAHVHRNPRFNEVSRLFGQSAELDKKIPFTFDDVSEGKNIDVVKMPILVFGGVALQHVETAGVVPCTDVDEKRGCVESGIERPRMLLTTIERDWRASNLVLVCRNPISDRIRRRAWFFIHGMCSEPQIMEISLRVTLILPRPRGKLTV